MCGRQITMTGSLAVKGLSWSPCGVAGDQQPIAGSYRAPQFRANPALPGTGRRSKPARMCLTCICRPNHHYLALRDTRNSKLSIRGRPYLRITPPAPVFAGRRRVRSGRGPSDTHPAPILASTGDGRPSGRNRSGCICGCIRPRSVRPRSGHALADDLPILLGRSLLIPGSTTLKACSSPRTRGHRTYGTSTVSDD
jgi:hypothetical protein